MERDWPTAYQKRTIWNALTGLAIVILGALLVGFILLSGKVLGYLQPVLVPLAVAGIIAYLLDPVVAWLQKKGLSRVRAVITVFCGFVIALCLAAAVVVPPLAEQIGELVKDRNTSEDGRQGLEDQALKKLTELKDVSFIEPVVHWAMQPVDADGVAIKDPQPALQKKAAFSERKLGYLLRSNTEQITSTLVSWLKGASKVFGIIGYTIGFAMVPIYLFYFLRESAAIKANWHDYVPLKASKFKNEVVESLTEINSYLISFFRGQVLVALIDGLLVGIALMIFQLPHALIIGLFLAVLGVIPFIGNLLCMIPACIIAFIHFSSSDANHQWLGSSPWAYVGAVVAIFVIVQQINSLVTAPKIVGDSVGLHPMTVIFSMLFWSLILGGFLGALLAVPLTAAVKVLIRRYVWERKILDPQDPGETVEPV